MQDEYLDELLSSIDTEVLVTVGNRLRTRRRKNLARGNQRGVDRIDSLLEDVTEALIRRQEAFQGMLIERKPL